MAVQFAPNSRLLIASGAVEYSTRRMIFSAFTLQFLRSGSRWMGKLCLFPGSFLGSEGETFSSHEHIICCLHKFPAVFWVCKRRFQTKLFLFLHDCRVCLPELLRLFDLIFLLWKVIKEIESLSKWIKNFSRDFNCFCLVWKSFHHSISLMKPKQIVWWRVCVWVCALT